MNNSHNIDIIPSVQTKIPKIIEGDFNEVINDAINKGRHVEYLKNTLKEYAQYKKVFESVLTDKNPSDQVYLFRVTYLNKKLVWRDIIIIGSQTFEDLAEAIIDSMDWDNDHMHGFSLPEKQKKGYFYYTPFTFFADGWEDDPYPTYKSNQIKICNIDYNLYPKLRFEFDFGDGHMFKVHFKETRAAQKGESMRTLPKVLDQRGVAPEQYPPLEEDFEHEEHENKDWFHADCKLCLDLKNQGIEMQWYPDQPPVKKEVIN